MESSRGRLARGLQCGSTLRGERQIHWQLERAERSEPAATFRERSFAYVGIAAVAVLSYQKRKDRVGRQQRRTMTPDELLQFMRTQRLAVEASRAPAGGVQAALVGIGVTDAFEIVFDTLASTRKAQNLRTSPRAAFVLGGWAADERTVQFEGIADEPVGAELDRIKTVYFAAWPDGPSRLSWPGITYFRVRPSWIRFSDFTGASPHIVEFTSDQLAAPSASVQQR